MQLKYNYWYFTKALIKDICNKIILAGNGKTKVKGEIRKEDSKSKYGVTPNKRKCLISWLNEQWIYDLINPFIHMANRNADWNFQLDWNDTCQFTEYNKFYFD